MRKIIDLSNLVTERESRYKDLEKMSIQNLIKNINFEDQTVPKAVFKARRQIAVLIKETIKTIKNGGRIFYIGAGTSGRLAVVDASECPPTFGVKPNTVIGIIAGGYRAIRKAVEGAEDSRTQAFKDLLKHNVSSNDIVIGVAASGRTPYVVGGLKKCRQKNIPTGCIVCNRNSPAGEYSDFPIEVIVGPEFLTGSSRMKAGTAQKLVLNTITTATFVKTGRVIGNKMSHVQATNKKLIERRIQMVIKAQRVNRPKAIKLLKESPLKDLLKK